MNSELKLELASSPFPKAHSLPAPLPLNEEPAADCDRMQTVLAPSRNGGPAQVSRSFPERSHSL